MHLNRTTTDLVALARTAAAEYQETCEGDRLRVEASQPELVGEWDAERLQRVLANLISNAIKYSPDGGPITISVDREGTVSILAVRDCGVGVPVADQAHLFEEFHRASRRHGHWPGRGASHR